MDLSIITVTFNARDQLEKLLVSVVPAAAGLTYEHIIVDNNSADETVKFIQAKYPAIKIIQNNHNAGYGSANNQGARMATGEFMLFLNPDMQLTTDSLAKLVNWFRTRPDVGIASCKLVDERGELNLSAKPRRFPTFWDQLIILLKLPHIFPSVNLSKKYYYADFNPEVEQEVDSVRGAFLLMRRELYNKTGWAFDPRYFIWLEDVDICRECYRHGFKVVYNPQITCVDFIGQTFQKMPSLWKQRQFTKSLLQYFFKWEPAYQGVILAIVRPVAILITAILKKS